MATNNAIYLALFLTACQDGNPNPLGSTEEISSTKMALATVCEGQQIDQVTCRIGARLDAAAKTIEVVSANYTPAALALDSEIPFAQSDDTVDPCTEETEELISFERCQPQLLRAYLSQVKRPMENVRKALVASKDLIGNSIASDSMRTRQKEGSADSGSRMIEYRIVSATSFELLIKSERSSVYFRHADNHSIEMKILEPAHENRSEMSGSATISFTDERNWTVENRIVLDECPQRTKGPKVAIVNISRADDSWQGKAQFYGTGGKEVCESTDHPGQVAWLTDFVGDAHATTAAIYFLPMNVDPWEINDFEAYAMTDLCTNVPSHRFCSGLSLDLWQITPDLCQHCRREHSQECSDLGVDQDVCQEVLSQAAGGWLPGDLSALRNPFCLSGDGGPTWGAPCTSNNSLISRAIFSDKSHWRHPKMGLDSATCIPESLMANQSCQTP